MNNTSRIPPAPLWLGASGLIPFVVSALAIWIASDAMQVLALQSLAIYGAVILSFLGGVKWGTELHDAERAGNWLRLSLSVTPALIAWPALLLPSKLGLTLLVAGFLLQMALDQNDVNKGRLPLWYGRLRVGLTTGAVLSLLLGWLKLVASS